MNSAYASTREPTQAEMMAAKLDKLQYEATAKGGQDIEELNLFQAIMLLQEQVEVIGKRLYGILDQLGIPQTAFPGKVEPQPQNMVEVLALRVNGARMGIEASSALAEQISNVLRKLQP